LDPLLSIAIILVSAALTAAILLQARGTGLSGTFGGDSAVYRSRRGVERRLYQFTIILLVLFVVISLVSYMIAVPPPAPTGT
jgi:preprotein translocase subunit SecG